jgi:hypothetical protein
MTYFKLNSQIHFIDNYHGATPSGSESVSGRIADIRTAVISGNTIYYFRLEDSDVFYSISAADSSAVVILSVGDMVTITYSPGEGSILSAVSVAIS